jgi:hypothetical protein
VVKQRNRHAPRARTDFLAWVDDANARDTGEVFAEMPPRSRMVYSRIPKPCYYALRR